ncbi:hypothetical protein ACFLZJ_00925 [Nanoarchaeota archaeon]
MKKGVLFLILILFLMLTLPLAFAQDEDEDLEASLSELEKIDNAYTCLKDAIEEQSCEDLSTEEKIFSLLAVGECKDELVEDSDDGKCWPKSKCDTKTTAQAILALEDRTSFNTEDAQEWLVSQNTTLSDIIWYLQIESSEQTSCTITYGENPYTVIIGEDKKIDSNAGSCLSVSSNEYWLEVSSPRSLGCYSYEYEISCDQNFITTLLFQNPDSSTIHVSEKASSAASSGTTKEKIDSFCFMQNGVCDYEASLWASIVLVSLDYDLSGHMPYLVTMAEENSHNLPESFLYLLTGYPEFKTNLLLKQKLDKYWKESGDEYYDTALALYPFQYGTLPPEKTSSEAWLLENQDRDGCWEGNVRNTGFILYSIWPDDAYNIHEEPDDPTDCEDTGYYCIPSGTDCGRVFNSYDCSAGFKCCSSPSIKETCSELNGIICGAGFECIGGRTESAAGLSSFEECCVGSSGYCGEVGPGPGPGPGEESECSEQGAICRSSCYSDEEEKSYECTYSSDSCCMEKREVPGGSYTWIWILLILIILVVLGIVFNDKLRPFWIKIKSGFRRKPRGPPGGRSGFGPRRPGMPPASSRELPRRPMMGRRVLPSGSRKPITGPRPRPRQRGEIDDVLKKLKEMGR